MSTVRSKEIVYFIKNLVCSRFHLMIVSLPIQDHTIVSKVIFFLIKGPRNDLSTECLKSVFPFLNPRMVNMGICNVLSKFGSQISRYRQDTEFEIFCNENKARMLLLFTHVFC